MLWFFLSVPGAGGSPRRKTGGARLGVVLGGADFLRPGVVTRTGEPLAPIRARVAKTKGDGRTRSELDREAPVRPRPPRGDPGGVANRTGIWTLTDLHGAAPGRSPLFRL